MLGRAARDAVDSAIGSTVLLVGIAAGPGHLAAGSIAQAEAVAVASDAMHLGQVGARLVGEHVTERATP